MIAKRCEMVKAMVLEVQVHEFDEDSKIYE
jgi:hypothetical protein